MSTNDSTSKASKTAADPRVPLGYRDKASVTQTVLRIVGKNSKAPVLDVAAFQSFAD